MLLFWKPAPTYSPGHVSASHIVLFFATRHKVPSALAGAQCVPFRVVKMQRRSPRSSFRRNYRVAHSFSLRGAYLAGHGKLCSSLDYKTKSPHCCVSFFLETGVDASRSALILVCAAPPQHNLRLARGRSFTQRENASRSDAPRSYGTIASSLIFPLRFLSVFSG